MIYQVLTSIFEIFALFGLGWLARKLKYISEEDIGRWSQFILDWLFPCLVFHTIVGGLEVESLTRLWPLPLIGLGMICLGTWMGVYLARGLHNPNDSLKRTFRHFVAVNNYGFLPILIVQNTWGNQFLAYLFLLNLGSLMGHWTIGVALLKEGKMGEVMRHLWSPTLVTILGAVAIVMCGLKSWVPEILLKVTQTTGSISVPLVLIVIGASLKGAPIKSMGWNLGYSVLIRLLIMPAMGIAILKALPLDREVYQTAFLVALMPVASSSPLFTRRFGGNPDFAAGAAVTSTLMAAVTIPLWLHFML